SPSTGSPGRGASPVSSQTSGTPVQSAHACRSSLRGLTRSSSALPTVVRDTPSALANSPHVQARRAEQTAHRLRGLTFLKARGRRNRRSVHAELSASPHPQGGESPPRQGRGDERITEEQARINAEGIALVRAALHEVAWLDEQRRPPRER